MTAQEWFLIAQTAFNVSVVILAWQQLRTNRDLRAKIGILLRVLTTGDRLPPVVTRAEFDQLVSIVAALQASSPSPE